MSANASIEKITKKRSGTAIRAKGQRRVNEILQAARDILVEDGYTQFSLRNVAGRAGIHLSNLQYYFSGKDELIHGLLEFIAGSYEDKYEEIFRELPEDPATRFEAVLRYLVSDIANPGTRRFFIQLWALLESSDAHSGVLLNELYALQLNYLTDLVHKVNPQLSPGKVQQRAAMISAMIEGMMLMLGDADEKTADNEAGIEDEMLKQFMRIAMDEQ